jgi:hypothetical protein
MDHGTPPRSWREKSFGLFFVGFKKSPRTLSAEIPIAFSSFAPTLSGQAGRTIFLAARVSALWMKSSMILCRTKKSNPDNLLIGAKSMVGGINHYKLFCQKPRGQEKIGCGTMIAGDN